MSLSSNSELRTATDTDVAAIVNLVNQAFAIESSFKTGDRIDKTQAIELMKDGEFLLLTDDGVLTACAYVKLNGDRCYIGLLSVHPGKQRSGIGARMMQEAEDLGRRAGCRFADIRTVSVRPELSVIYHKLGYIETGVESAAVIKTATMPVHFVTMSKPL